MNTIALYDKFLQSRSISTDTRNITPGCIFFALKGDNFNGNRFAAEALEKGACAAVIDEDMPVADARIIRVENVLSSLQQLATYHRKQLALPVLAITGSNGKTTTKELCKAVLSRKYKVHATQGNLNNHIGVPLTLLSIGQDCEFAIIEMGANHHGEIDTLCRIALPDYGLITNIGKAHLEGFGGIEGVARAKGELIRYLLTGTKTIFLNGGNPYLAGQVPAGYSNVIRYNTPGGLVAENITVDPFLSFAIRNGITADIRTKLAGGYNTENVLAAIAVGLYFKVPLNDIQEAIHFYEPKNSRSQIIKTGHNTVFMDAYNANPSSMTAAISEFFKTGDLQKMLILGEMKEMGDTSEAEHEEIIALLRKHKAENVYCVGKAFEKSATAAGYRYASSVDQLSELLAGNPPQGFYIMVKGSRSNQLEKILPLL